MKAYFIKSVRQEHSVFLLDALRQAVRERFKIQDINAEVSLATFLRLASESLNQAAEESRGVLNNLNLLDDPAAAQIDKTITLIHTALAHFSS